jgi:hypothetical protein
MNNLIETRLTWNQESRENWDCFHQHRRKATDLVVSKLKSQNDRLCILVAGNCNDLDLNILVSQFKEIHLVDIDTQAVCDGIARQELSDCNKIFTHGSIDLSGAIHFLTELSQEHNSAESRIKLFIQTEITPLNLNITEPFELVVSVCTLTQLINTAVRSLGDNHPNLFDLILKIRNHHLDQLINLVKPQGCGILITDIVSSDSSAGMAHVSEESFPEIVDQLIANQNFFHGVNPYRIGSVLSSNPLVSGAKMLSPWRWNFGSRIYAVCAIEAYKK